ncbi:MAG: hypothetical protein D6798_18910 [Deltaproteobacteria bacterium]|nr:MAG: hypothetical protein D6798_18910 [Deltaproteobacteria bacterium]
MSRRGTAITGAALLGGLAWRLWLMGRYYGWEESDYGNLAMVRGVLDGHFLHYDMNHMPGYYGLAAVVLAVVGDTVVAARAVSLVGGLVALWLALRLARHLAGDRAAAVTGLLLVFQPEFALYAATSLREPLYAAFVLGCLLMLGRERLVAAGALAGAAFLVRFDAAVILGLVMAAHALGRGPRLRRLVAASTPLLAAIAAWSTYTWIDHGTPLFWQHAVAVNVETGLGAEAEGRLQWVANGLAVSASLFARVLPSRIGWGPWLGLFAACLWTPWRRHGLPRTATTLALAMLGFWLSIGFVGQHSPDHNLYWKWLCPVVPVAVPVAIAGLLRLLAGLPPTAGRVVLGIAVLQALVAGFVETGRQVRRSAAWYGPQLHLARWIEEEVPVDVPLLIDNIPACWIDRRPHERAMTSWFDVPVPPGDPEAFAAWLRQEGIGWVLWFREEWTQAPVIAPFLADGGDWRAGGVHLHEVAREDGYGWILFAVEGVAGPERPPPL